MADSEAVFTVEVVVPNKTLFEPSDLEFSHFLYDSRFWQPMMDDIRTQISTARMLGQENND